MDTNWTALLPVWPASFRSNLLYNRVSIYWYPGLSVFGEINLGLSLGTGAFLTPCVFLLGFCSDFEYTSGVTLTILLGKLTWALLSYFGVFSPQDEWRLEQLEFLLADLTRFTCLVFGFGCFSLARFWGVSLPLFGLLLLAEVLFLLRFGDATRLCATHFSERCLPTFVSKLLLPFTS